MINDVLQNHTAHALFVSSAAGRQTRLTGEHLDERLKSFEMNDLAKPKFWRVNFLDGRFVDSNFVFQLSSKRTSDQSGVLQDQQLPKEMALTLVMLLGGTPVLANGDELGLDQVKRNAFATGAEPSFRNRRW